MCLRKLETKDFFDILFIELQIRVNNERGSYLSKCASNHILNSKIFNDKIKF